MWKFEKELRKDYPQTIGETDKYFDLDNYKDWLEEELTKSKISNKSSTTVTELQRSMIKDELYNLQVKFNELSQFESCTDTLKMK